MKKKRLLIIDDDSLFRDSAKQYLSSLPVDIHLADSGKKGLSLCSEIKMDIVLLDQKLPDIKGADLYKSILSTNDRVKIIFITAYPDLKNAVNALKDGVHDYITKPLEPVELSMTISRIIGTIDLERTAQVQEYNRFKETSEAFLVGHGKIVKELRTLITRASDSLSPVFFSGETGTGKNRLAKAIHYNGPSSDKPFLIVNCAAIPENLIEAELFGVEKGAFTGADKTKKGLFELAEGGTLFLDEVGEMPVTLQSKLLGVLDEKKFKKDEIHPSTLIKITVPESENDAISETHKGSTRKNFETLKLMEENHIRLALDQVAGNYTHAAKLLGISRSTLMRKLQTY